MSSRCRRRRRGCSPSPAASTPPTAAWRRSSSTPWSAGWGLRRRCRTRDFRLDGAPRGPWERFEPAAVRRLQSRWSLSEEDARHLVGRYGVRADDVAEYLGRDPTLRGRITPDEPDLLAEFAYQRDHEMAMTPADLLLRRTRLGLFRPELLGEDKRLFG